MMLIMPHMLMGTSRFRECSVSAYVRHQCDTLSTQLSVAERVKEYFNFRMRGGCNKCKSSCPARSAASWGNSNAIVGCASGSQPW